MASTKLSSPLTALLDQGLVRYAEGFREEAISLWQQALEQAPEDRRARDYLKSVGAITAGGIDAGSVSSPDVELVVGDEDIEDGDSGAQHGESLVPPFTSEVSTYDPDDEEDDSTQEIRTENVVPDVEILLRNARQEHGGRNLEAALKYAEEALKRDPDHEEAVPLAAALRKELADQYRAELEPLEQVPYLTANDASILELSLDKIGGFLISQIDGEITLDELLNILSTFDEFRVLSSLHFFLENGIIELRS